MNEKYTPKSTDELIAALADGEVQVCDCPELFSKLSGEASVGRKIADQQRLRDAVSCAICGPVPGCPDELRAELEAMCGKDASAALGPTTAEHTPATAPAYAKYPATASPVLARITRWIPAALAAVLLIAAGVVFSQSSRNDGSQAASILSVAAINTFANRHADCAVNPALLYDTDRFGDPASIQALPGRIGDYFDRSANGINLDLSRVGYDYQMTGVCSIAGRNGIHLVYRHQQNPERAISLWLRPDDGSVAIAGDRLYVEAAKNLDHPVILWKANGMIYFLVGDSLEDAHVVVDELRESA